MQRVFITDFSEGPPDIEQRELDGVATVEALRCSRPDELPDRVAEAAGLLVYHVMFISPEVLDRVPKCRVVTRCGVGFDNVDLKAAAQRGVYVCNVPDYGTEEVADHAMAMILTLGRKVALQSDAVRASADNWTYQEAEPVHRLRGQTLGIIGLGRIGTAVALRAKPFGLRLLACDPYIPDGIGKALGVEMRELDDLLRESDIVTLHTPLTAETRSMMSRDRLALMKPAAVLINTARGGIVDSDALADALAGGRLGGAGLDVCEVEPIPADGRLYRAWQTASSAGLRNLLITPHSAFYSEEAFAELRAKGARTVRRVLEGKPPRNCVNLEYFDK